MKNSGGIKYLDLCDTISMSAIKDKFVKGQLTKSYVTKEIEENGKKRCVLMAFVSVNLTGVKQKFFCNADGVRKEINQPSNTIYFFRCLKGRFIVDGCLLVERLSNLGIGKVWYMVCPYTLKLCRKLYYDGGHFISRHAFSLARYSIQSKSRKCRDMERYFEIALRVDDDDEPSMKWHKPFYRGKQTRTERRLVKKLDKSMKFLMAHKDGFL